ncbi:DUF2269 family protein [Neobacillus rhizophilus]|uniref:DUF2269 family protein n=1 Tax=Neobacillus rhizophilus TaxID=2833579 RepID=A0A942U1J7_9BACI|nr:DUF2269 family protein [Neobacillus rhizophilus]MBS4211072.1 DUF2269 family protein [Neobacillus rhizophilus]
MEWIVLLHVVSAVVGLGPAYAFPLILRKEKSLEEVKRMADLVTRLEILPKIFGGLTLLTGILLVWLGNYGTFFTLWIAAVLILFILAEVVIIGFLTPAAKKLAMTLTQLTEQGKSETNPITLDLLSKVRNYHIASCVIVLVIIALMVLKPV